MKVKQYAIYLRKSRADIEAEARGEGETLARHRTALEALAKRRGLFVAHEYSEVITGDSIAARPQMQLLLEDVKQGKYAGVIVNDVDRLGRGDSIDQEIIKYTFVAGNCIIITPSRDIDPASPTDVDMLDFSMFFARFEYRKISQRLMQGRTRSAVAGNYISARVPYGYKKVTNGKSIRLVPDEETAKVVKMIFDWYVTKQYGYHAIASKLNEMGLKTYMGNNFTREYVRKILVNPVYTGCVVWGKTATISAIEDGHRLKKHIASTPTIVQNAHEAIISDEVFNQVQAMFRETQHANPVNAAKKLSNPLAGLLYCPICGHTMEIRGHRKKNRNDYIITCMSYGCPTRGTYISIIVNALMEILQQWCVDYVEPEPEPEPKNDDTNQLIRKQIASTENQISKAQELVELGIYTPSEYVQRKNDLQQRLKLLYEQLEVDTPVSVPNTINRMLPQIHKVLDAYPLAETTEQKNQLLKSIIARIDFHKTKIATKAVAPESIMELVVYPRLDPNRK